MAKNRPTRNFPYFLAELLILVIGISISFLLNEYRVQQKEKRQEVDLLNSFKSNLISDSTQLSLAIKQTELQIESGQRVLALAPRTAFKDSLALDVIRLLSYYSMKPTDITYQEMKSVGNTHIISNDELLTAIISLYESNYEAVAIWAEIDGDHVKDKMIGFTMDNLPFAAGLNYTLLSDKDKSEFMRQITTNHFKYLVQFGLSYKQSSLAIFKGAQNQIKLVLDTIEEDLAN